MVCVSTLAYLTLGFIKVDFLKSEKRAYSKVFNRLFWEKFEFFCDLHYFALVSLLDTIKQKWLDFCLFEEKSHDKVVNILIFDQFSILLTSKILKSINVSDNCNHELHKNANLISDSGKFRNWNGLKMMIKLPIQRLKKTSIGMLLKHISPFQKDMQRRWIVLNIDFFFV